ncbi:N-(5'-phosphoribosyl)anthranilate isomerase [Alphaproteobacteria bacterium KMM 3653]|uniref:N-(5'-phosphoribosyl)anthranilate isomerase n=1 Tax=Harenicola maris TaxID=2841044 RepID=A0AAP2CQL5_9RHOB|nr:N-(5'-phosphoribosyl)anthranilate isomerase [Harenicola maris]
MQNNITLSRPGPWIDHLFSAVAAQKGGVVRRSVAWVEREVGLERFKEEVRLRGFRLLQSGGQFIIICNRTPLKVIV